MTDRYIPDAVVFPEDEGTGAPVDRYGGDRISAGHLATLASNAAPGTYVASGLDLSANFTSNILTVTGGSALLKSDGDASITVQDADGDYTIPWPHPLTFAAGFTADLDVGLFDNAANDVWLAIDRGSEAGMDDAFIRVGPPTQVSAPPAPSVHLGTVDTSSGSISLDADFRGPPVFTEEGEIIDTVESHPDPLRPGTLGGREINTTGNERWYRIGTLTQRFASVELEVTDTSRQGTGELGRNVAQIAMSGLDTPAGYWWSEGFGREEAECAFAALVTGSGTADVYYKAGPYTNANLFVRDGYRFQPDFEAGVTDPGGTAIPERRRITSDTAFADVEPASISGDIVGGGSVSSLLGPNLSETSGKLTARDTDTQLSAQDVLNILTANSPLDVSILGNARTFGGLTPSHYLRSDQNISVGGDVTLPRGKHLKFGSGDYSSIHDEFDTHHPIAPTQVFEVTDNNRYGGYVFRTDLRGSGWRDLLELDPQDDWARFRTLNLDIADGDLTMGGNAGPFHGAGGRTATVAAPENQIAQISALGSGGQGTGYMYVGQNAGHGGGITYNGDNTPGMPQTNDAISIFRRSGSSDHEVLHWTHGNNTANFHGDGNLQGNRVVNTREVHYDRVGSAYLNVDVQHGNWHVYDRGTNSTPFSVYNTNSVAVEAGQNPGAGSPMFLVSSAGGSMRLRADHEGTVRTDNLSLIVGNSAGGGGPRVIFGSGAAQIDHVSGGLVARDDNNNSTRLI